MNLNEFTISGPKYFKIWQFNFQEKNLVATPIDIFSKEDENEKKINIVDHCWIPNSSYLVVVND